MSEAESGEARTAPVLVTYVTVLSGVIAVMGVIAALASMALSP